VIISHRWRFVYVGPPKTASTTLHHWLSQPAFCDERWTPEHQDQHSVVIPPEVQEYFTFASIRDPLDRAVSLWRHSQSPTSLAAGEAWPMSFEEFVLEFQPHASWFYRLSQAEMLASVRLDAVVRVERLEEDLLRLPPIAKAVGAGEVLESVPWLNPTRCRRKREVCTTMLTKAIESRWAADREQLSLEVASRVGGNRLEIAIGATLPASEPSGLEFRRLVHCRSTKHGPRR